MAVFVETFAMPPINRKEALRYAGARESTPETEKLLDECLRLTQGKLRYQVCWAQFEIQREAGGLNLGFAQTDSKSLARNLEGCTSIILFAATIGVELDRLIARYTRLSPATAHMLQALGAERIESLCDAFQSRIAREFGPTRPRYSPGYGDVPLEMQRHVMQALDCSRKIGVSLNQSLLMSPSKSVTAIIGLGKTGCETPSGCAACENISCSYRREA